VRRAGTALFFFAAACAAGSSGTPIGSPSPSTSEAPDAAAATAAVVTAPTVTGEGGAPSQNAPSSAAADGGAAEPVEIAISDEPPYAPGARRHPGGGVAASHDDDVLARWNRGGPETSGPAAVKPPHPAPRVKVDVVQVRGHIEEADVLRTARAKGYWPFRLCYEEGLRRVPKLHGTIRLRLTIGPGGTARGVRKVAAEVDDATVTSCVLKAARGLSLASPDRGTPDVTLEVSLWPGDAPVRSGSAPAARASDVPEALIAALRSRWDGVRACYTEGLRRTPGLWGRLAMRFHVTAKGDVVEATEVESRFPDRDVTECALRVYERAGLSPYAEDRVFVYPLRLGTPP
jgi:hypothetical protein